MDKTPAEDPPPKSTDLCGWRAAIKDGRYRQFRLEALVAAIQDLGPHTENDVLNPLAKHLSDSMLGILRSWVGFHHPNEGRDIIERVHAQLWDALLKPHSADGKGMRVAFGSRLKFRLKDAIAVEARAFRSPDENVAKSKKTDKTTSDGEDARKIESLADHPEPHEVAEDSDDQVTVSRRVTRDPAGFLGDAVRHAEEERYVESVLQLITDDRRRLAFRLHMDGVPYKSTKFNSIEAALGVSERTARQWVKEVQEFLKTKLGGKP